MRLAAALAISCIPKNEIIMKNADDIGADELVSIAICADRITRLIRAASPQNQMWLGAIDISFNVSRIRETRRTWCFHGMFITPRVSKSELFALRGQLETTHSVSRPLYRSSIYNLNGLSDYIFKAKFRQREEYLNSASRRSTSNRRLQGAPQTTLIEHFAETPHSDRVIAIGCRRKLAGA